MTEAPIIDRDRELCTKAPLNQLQTVPTDLAVKPKEVLGHGLACISGDEISR